MAHIPSPFQLVHKLVVASLTHLQSRVIFSLGFIDAAASHNLKRLPADYLLAGHLVSPFNKARMRLKPHKCPFTAVSFFELFFLYVNKVFIFLQSTEVYFVAALANPRHHVLDDVAG